MGLMTRLASITAGLVLLPAAAMASPEIVSTPDGRPLSLEQLAPGSSRTSPITITNPSPGPARVALGVVVTEDDENGCLLQEQRAGDTSCEDGEGELSEWLAVTVAREGQVLWTGPMRDLGERTLLAGQLPEDGSWDLDVTIGMPLEAGNETMTDRIAFDLVVALRTATGPDDTDVLGVEATAPDGNDVAGEQAGNSGVPSVVAAGLDLPGIRELRTWEAERLWLLLISSLAVVAAAGMTISRVRRR